MARFELSMYPKTAPQSAFRFRCRLMQVRPEPRHILAGHPMRAAVLGTQHLATAARPPRFRCDPLARDVALDPGRSSAPRITVPCCLRANEKQNMSIEDDPKKLRQDDAQATPEWHRARAKDLRKNGFTKMAEEHEHIARTIERQRREQQQTK